MDDEPRIPWPNFAAFLRQHTHDSRNDLNGLELETALLQELVADDEARASVERLRKQVRAMGGQLRSLSALLQEVRPNAARTAASDLFLIWSEQHAGLTQPLDVRWNGELGVEEVNVDAAMMATVFRELLTNAAAFSEGGTVSATARREGDVVVFELREPKKGPLNPSEWGVPLSSTRRGGYGLGLWSARRLLAANQARLTQRHAPNDCVLVSRILLPVCK